MANLALDASTKCCGYTLFSGDKYIHSGIYKPAGQAGFGRIKDYGTWLDGLLVAEKIETVVYENPSGVHGNMTTNLLLGALKFYTWLICNNRGIVVYYVSPSQVKKTGIYKGQYSAAAKYKKFDIVYHKKGRYEGKINKSQMNIVNDEIDSIGVWLAWRAKNG